MSAFSLDSFEKSALEIPKVEMLKKMDKLNTCFTTSVAPENNMYGLTEVLKDTGVLEKTWRDESGLLNREYYREGKLFEARSRSLDGNWLTTRFDENGTAYLKETTDISKKNMLKTVSLDLTPNVEVVKGNFSSIIDEFGRPVLNKISDLSLKAEDRESLSSKLRDDTYLDGDERGHIIADMFNGPASKENVVPQSYNVNHYQMSAVEKLVKQYKEEGHTVDYEVKTNYVGTDKRPSSFEPKITVDGDVVELPKEMQKIYNTTEEAGIFTRVTTIVGEKVGLYNEIGVKVGLESAAITCAVSTIDNVTQFMDGQISAEEMVIDIAKDTGIGGAVGYGSAFISSAVASELSQSSHELFRVLSKSGVPAAVIAFGISSYDSISEFAQGEIDGVELAYDLGDNAAAIAGGFIGTAVVAPAGAAASIAVGTKVGAVVGSVVPGVGTAVGAASGAAVGFGINVVGGMVGTAIATGAYQTAIELGSDGVEVLADKLQEVAGNTVEQAKIEMADQVDNIRMALNNFASGNNIPIHV